MLCLDSVPYYSIHDAYWTTWAPAQMIIAHAWLTLWSFEVYWGDNTPLLWRSSPPLERGHSTLLGGHWGFWSHGSIHKTPYHTWAWLWYHWLWGVKLLGMMVWWDVTPSMEDVGPLIENIALGEMMWYLSMDDSTLSWWDISLWWWYVAPFDNGAPWCDVWSFLMMTWCFLMRGHTFWSMRHRLEMKRCTLSWQHFTFFPLLSESSPLWGHTCHTCES